MTSPDPQLPRAPTLRETIASVAAAFFGVQSSKNRERDFTHGRPLPFIVVGLAMTAGFVLLMLVVVKLVLHFAR